MAVRQPQNEDLYSFQIVTSHGNDSSLRHDPYLVHLHTMGTIVSQAKDR